MCEHHSKRVGSFAVTGTRHRSLTPLGRPFDESVESYSSPDGFKPAFELHITLNKYRTWDQLVTMKFSYAALCAALMSSSGVEGFVGQGTVPRSTMQLDAHKDSKQQKFGSAFVAAVAGWTLASQVAFAGVTTPINSMYPKT